MTKILHHLGSKTKGGRAGGGGAKSGFVQTFGLTRRIRWRVPELTPNTPGPEASAGYVAQD